MLPGCTTSAPANPARSPLIAGHDRIDTHHHFWSPALVATMEKMGEGTPIMRNWSVNRTLDDMDKGGVATSILSLTAYIGSLPNAAARAAARESNEWATKLRSDKPGRFGLFAAIPMQDTEGALREIEYALDVLKADGIGVHTNYGGNKWLGHPSFAPIMDELNRRQAIVYTHPRSASCCVNLQTGIPDTVVEFGTDTTRTIIDTVFSGTAARYTNLRYIFSHAGGTLPFLTERLVMAPVLDPKLQPRVPRGVLTELQRFYYDTAWAMRPVALASLTQLVGSSQILLGSDYPYRTGYDTVTGVEAYGFAAADLRAIERDNAMRLMPRLGA